MQRMRVTAAAALALAVGCVALSGCTPDAPVETVTPTVTVTETTTPTPSAPVETPTVSPSSDIGAGQELPHCTSDRVQTTFEPDPMSSGAGQSYFLLTITNTSDSTCMTRGWAGVTFEDGNGNRMITQTSNPSDNMIEINLAPGESAQETIQTSSPGAYSCPSAQMTQATVILPFDEVSQTFPAKREMCLDVPQSVTITRMEFLG